MYIYMHVYIKSEASSSKATERRVSSPHLSRSIYLSRVNPTREAESEQESLAQPLEAEPRPLFAATTGGHIRGRGFPLG